MRRQHGRPRRAPRSARLQVRRWPPPGSARRHRAAAARVAGQRLRQQVHGAASESPMPGPATTVPPVEREAGGVAEHDLRVQRVDAGPVVDAAPRTPGRRRRTARARAASMRARRPCRARRRARCDVAVAALVRVVAARRQLGGEQGRAVQARLAACACRPASTPSAVDAAPGRRGRSRRPVCRPGLSARKVRVWRGASRRRRPGRRRRRCRHPGRSARPAPAPGQRQRVDALDQRARASRRAGARGRCRTGRRPPGRSRGRRRIASTKRAPAGAGARQRSGRLRASGAPPARCSTSTSTPACGQVGGHFQRVAAVVAGAGQHQHRAASAGRPAVRARSRPRPRRRAASVRRAAGGPGRRLRWRGSGRRCRAGCPWWLPWRVNDA